MTFAREDTTVEATRFHVVVNDEEQFSLWPVAETLPPGWRPDGFTGAREECLAHIDATWTDLRPASVRRAADPA